MQSARLLKALAAFREAIPSAQCYLQEGVTGKYFIIEVRVNEHTAREWERQNKVTGR